MLSFIIGTIFALAMFILSSLYARYSIAMVGLADIVLMIFSFVYLFRQKKYIFYSFSIPLTVVEKEQPFHAHLKIDRLTAIRNDRVKILLEYKNGSEERCRKLWLVNDRAKAQNGEILYEITATKAGRYEFNLKKLRIYDVFGLFYVDIKAKSDNIAIVLPKLESQPVSIGSRIKNFYSDSDVFYKDRSGYDPSETYDIREYRPGDRLPSVHWKLSAKKDELVVRENSRPLVFSVVILINLYGNMAEDLLDKIASLSFALTQNECPHYLAWFSNTTHEIRRIGVEDEDRFYEAIVEYMSDCAAMPKTDLLEEYKEVYRGEHWLYDILVSGEDVMLNGEKIEISSETCLIFE